MAKAKLTDKDTPGTPEGSPRRSSRLAALAKESPKVLKPVQTPQRIEKKQPVKKTPVKKKVAEGESEKKTPVKKTPVKKAPVKKTPEKKAPVKKTPVKKAPVKKAPAKKETPKKTPLKAALKIPATEKTEKKPAAKVQLNTKETKIPDPKHVMAEKRRNAKRKADEVPDSDESDEAPENLLEEALRPLTDEERAEWPGWIELESEPVRLLRSTYCLPTYTV